MSDDENTVAKEIQKQTKGYLDGVADTWENRLPNAAVNPADYGIRMGRAAREGSAGGGSGESGNAERQTFGDAVSTLMGLGGLAAGFLFGLYLIGVMGQDLGWMLLVLLAVTTIGGALSAITLSMVVQSRIRALRESVQWKRGRSGRNAESLGRMWADKFGMSPIPQLIEQIDEGGAAWIMDKKANFVLRMKDGKKLYVGHEPGNGKLTINSGSGRRFDRHDAYYMMLAHHSVGNRSITLKGGMKKAQRLMWAAAKLTGLEVTGYQPDRKGHQTLEAMRRDFTGSQTSEGTTGGD